MEQAKAMQQAAEKEAEQAAQRAADQAEARAEAEAEAALQPLPSRVVLKTLALLIIFQQTIGVSIPFGGSVWGGSLTYPDQGQWFREGSPHFTRVAELLETARAHSWTGVAGDANATVTSELATQARKVAELDLEMEKLIKAHAEFVSYSQLGIGAAQDALIVTLFTVLGLERFPATLPAAKTTATIAMRAAVVAALAATGVVLGSSIKTVVAVDKLGYDEVLAAVRKLPITPASAQTPAPQSRQSVVPGHVGDFGSLPAPSGVSGAPSLASSPRSASGVGSPQAPLYEPTGEREHFGDDAPQVAPNPGQLVAPAPQSPMPSVAQVSRSSGQAAYLSASSASPSNRSNAQGQPADVDEAVRGDDSEDAAAVSGTRGAERAPIDVAAAGREQAPAPNPASRT